MKRMLIHFNQPLARKSVGRALSNSADGSEVKQQLSKFSGGAVRLQFLGPANSFAQITIDNPLKKNAFTGSMCVQLREIVDELKNWPGGRGVILTGSNGMFCAGADLNMIRQMSDKQRGDNFSRFMQTVTCDLRQLPIPTVALVRDHVYGGGAELMVATDLQLASPDTKICFVQGRMGIITGWSGTTHLVEKVGYNKALYLLLSRRVIERHRSECSENFSTSLAGDFKRYYGRNSVPFSRCVVLMLTAEALHLNLITDIITKDLTDEQDFLGAGVEYLEKLCGDLSPVVIQGMKRACTGAAHLPYRQSVDNERTIFRSLWGANDNLTALGMKSRS